MKKGLNIIHNRCIIMRYRITGWEKRQIDKTALLYKIKSDFQIGRKRAAAANLSGTQKVRRHICRDKTI